MQRVAASVLRTAAPQYRASLAAPVKISHFGVATNRLSTFKPASGISRISHRKISTTNLPPSVSPSPIIASLPQDATTKVAELTGPKLDISSALFEGTPTSQLSTTTGVTSMLDFWQPVQWMTQLLENLHTYTGLPWWSTIILQAFILRTLLVPGNIVSLKMAAKVAVRSYSAQFYHFSFFGLTLNCSAILFIYFFNFFFEFELPFF